MGISFLSSFVLGLAHALQPGHGKSFLLAFAIGEKFRPRHVLALGVGLLASHFCLLAIIAAVVVYSISGADEHWLHWINGVLGPVLMVAFGLYLLFNVRRAAKARQHPDGCACGGSHSSRPLLEGGSGMKKAVMAGLLSGFVPCPTVMLPIMLWGTSNDLANALPYLLLYASGMSLLLTMLLAGVLFAKNGIVQHFGRLQASANLPLLSALGVIFIGLLYLGLGLAGQHVH